MGTYNISYVLRSRLQPRNAIEVGRSNHHQNATPPLYYSSLRFQFPKSLTFHSFTLTRSPTTMATHFPPNDSTDFSSPPHSDYAEIVVVRHGETAWNAISKIQGQLDVELNETGRQQAAAVGDRLSRESKLSVIYSSDLQRASETAQIIASKCGGVEVVKDADLRERHLGDLQGLVYSELAKTKPTAYKAFVSKNEDMEIPGGGESLVQLYDRSTSALLRIATKHIGERVVVVTHGGFIRSLYQRACPNGGRPGKVLNTSVSVFHLDAEEDKWILKMWGDVSHLSQTGFLQSGFGGDRTSG